MSMAAAELSRRSLGLHASDEPHVESAADLSPRPHDSFSVNIAERALYLTELLDMLPELAGVEGFEFAASFDRDIQRRYSRKKRKEIIEAGKEFKKEFNAKFRKAWGLEMSDEELDDNRLDPVAVNFFAAESRKEFVRTYTGSSDAQEKARDDYKLTLAGQRINFGKVTLLHMKAENESTPARNGHQKVSVE